MSNFDLKKFLVENKLTRNSRTNIIKENAEVFLDTNEDVFYDIIQRMVRDLPSSVEMEPETMHFLATRAATSPEIQSELMDYCDGDQDVCQSVTDNLINLLYDVVEDVADTVRSQDDRMYDSDDNYEDFEDTTPDWLRGTKPGVEKPISDYGEDEEGFWNRRF